MLGYDITFTGAIHGFEDNAAVHHDVSHVGGKAPTGYNMADNGPEAKWWLRAVLIVLAFIGTILTADITGTPVDPNTVTDLFFMFVETGAVAYLSHAFYNSFFRR